MDRSYRDNPFDPRPSNSDLNQSYDDYQPAASTRGYNNTNNIPLGNVYNPNPVTPYLPATEQTRPYTFESTDDLRGGRAAVGAGYGMNSRTGGGFANNEPKLGAYSSGSAWREPQAPRSNRRKWIVMGSIIAVVGIIIVAVVVGVVASNSHKKSSNNLSSNSGSAPATNSSVKQSDPNDASSFTKDPNFHQSFYGIAYTPVGSQLPDCGNSLAAVIQDIQIMSQLTPRVRLYGADCNQSALVLEAIKQTKVNMTVYLGNYPVPTDNGAAYMRQRDAIQDALKTYGADHVGGITVGNEFMLNYVSQHGITGTNDDTGVNSDLANVGAKILVANIDDTKNMLATMGLNIPVGNADAGSYFSNLVLADVNYGMANVHPWFANVSAPSSAAWTANFFQQQDIAQAAALPNNPTMYIAETGWPTKSSDAGNANNGASDASIANLQTFLDTFVCQANANGTGYFFFEFADEDWKDKQFGGVEGWWGLFNQDRSLKSGITIPNCQAP